MARNPALGWNWACATGTAFYATRLRCSGVASGGAVDGPPFAVAAAGDGDRLHERAAVGIAVAGRIVVEMAAPQACGAVVAVRGADGTDGDVQAASPASECVRATTGPMAL